LRINSYTIHFIKGAIQWFLWYPQNCAMITTINFKTFIKNHYKKKKKKPLQGRVIYMWKPKIQSPSCLGHIKLCKSASIRRTVTSYNLLHTLKHAFTCMSSFSSVQFSRSVMSDSLWPHESQHARPPCPSPTPGVHPDSRPSSQWCHPAISSSVIPFSSCPQSLPASESFPNSQLFAWGVQSTGVSALASFLPKKSQGWSPSEWTGWISLQSKGLSRVFSNIPNITVCHD